MILLVAPVIWIFERLEKPGDFQDMIRPALMSLGARDAENIFTAIRLANPGGLGNVDKYDVDSSVDIDIYSAMDAA